MDQKAQEVRTDGPTWAKRVGVAGFLFFLVKGLLWLTVPALVYVFSVD
ncbi:MAG TPA: hypothetical protein PKM58_03590 [Pyrinomonadaceae bacterium]|nr:hypothetical protein [Pyrinomonadaceae bacterium]HNU07372.1 hypothetical protein [Pyrinomonadaceae bacterium]